MKPYRKKPTIVHAVKFRIGEQCDSLAEYVISGKIRYTEQGTIEIKTLEGTMVASDGDYIVKGIAGELYPCKPDIFEALHEPLSKE